MTIFYREYDNYKEYLAHQASKLDVLLKKKNKWTQCVRPECFDKRVRKFTKNLKRYLPYLIEGNVLCLGARNGAEVKAFRRLGVKEAIGIDLNPGEDNKYVIHGDFHNMEFEDNSFQNVFTNSLDHILDIRKLSKEIHRILVPSGRIVLEISHFLDFEEENRQEDLKKENKYESFCCDNFRDIEDGFKEMKVIRKKEVAARRLMVVLENIKAI